MAIQGVRFAGTDLYKPGSYATRNFMPFTSGGASGSVALVIGSSTKGIPHNAADKTTLERVNWVSNLDEARALGSGAGYDYLKFVLSPSPELNPPTQVGFIRVNSATHSTATVQDIDKADAATLTTVDYGLHTEQVRFSFADATNLGAPGKKIIVQYGDTQVSGDDIDQVGFTIRYSGATTTAILTLDPSGALIVATGGTDRLSLTIASYPTLSSLVAKINTHVSTFYSATLYDDGDKLSSELDKVVVGDAVNIKSVDYKVRSNLQACLDWINNSSDYLTIALKSGGTRRRLLNGASYTTPWTWKYTTGGSDGSTSTTFWTAAVALSQLVTDASFVGIATSDSSIAATLSASVSYMNGPSGRGERQGYCGAAWNTAKATKIAAAQAIGNSAMCYCGDYFYRYNDAGTLTRYDGFYMSAILMGIMAGNDTPPTFKKVNVIKLGAQHTDTDLKDYISGGVVVCEQAPTGGFRIVRSVTTSTSTNLSECEASMIKDALWMTKFHRTTLENIFIGKPGDSFTIDSINQNSKRILDEFTEKYRKLVVDPAYGNAWRNHQMTISGDTFRIQYEGTQVSPVNFILTTHNFTVIGAKR